MIFFLNVCLLIKLLLNSKYWDGVKYLIQASLFDELIYLE